MSNQCEVFHDVKNTNLYPLRPFSNYVTDEFENRKLNRDSNYTEKLKDTVRSAWCRVTSLANVSIKNGSTNRYGFVLYNNEGFNKIYGFDPTLNNQQVLGRDRFGNTHTLDVNLDYKSLKTPAPGVTTVNSELLGGEGKFRNLSFNIQCHDKFQLEYLSPYFLTPGVTVLVEWGWDTFNEKGSNSLVDLNPRNDAIPDIRNSWDTWEARRCKSSGRYDMFIGIVTDFGYSMGDNNTFDCEISLKSISEQIYGYETNQEQVFNTTVDSKSGNSVENLTKQFDLYLESSINSVEREMFYGRGKFTKNIYVPYKQAEFVNNQLDVFSRDTLHKLDTSIDNDNVPSDVRWLTFGLFIDMINNWSHRSGKDTKIDDAMVFDLRESDICGHPNLKSTSQDVFIPNPQCPAWAFSGDNIHNLYNSKNQIFKPDKSGFLESARVANEKIKGSLGRGTVNKANRKAGIEKYNYDTFSGARFNLAKILSGKNPSEGSKIGFPVFDNIYKGYGGKLTSIYISDTLIKQVFSNRQSLRKMIQEILDTMSAAASGIWNFDIVDTSPGVLSIIDKNYPGTKKNEGIIRVDKLLDEDSLYTFSTLDNKSVITNLDFDANLPDSVALQTLFQNTDSLTYDKSSDIFRSKLKARDGTPISIEDRYSTFGSGSRTEPILGSSDENAGIYTAAREDYISIEVDPNSFKGPHFKLRFTEANEEVARQAIYNDESVENTSIYNRVVPGITVKFDTVGISGIRFMDCFKIDSLPYPYDTDVLYQVKQVKHIIKGNDWKTIVEAAVRPSPLIIGATKS